MAMDAGSTPNCAICNAPAYPEQCSCESERLELAVKQAERRAMEARLAEIRDWVITHARDHILHHFQRLSAARKSAHATYLSSLPCYNVYMQYSGHPPLHSTALQQLQMQITEANSQLKRGIDADWRASVMRYPEVLDYFYSLVELRLPHGKSASVLEPPFAQAGYSDKGYDWSNGMLKEGKKKSKKERAGTASPPPMVPMMGVPRRDKSRRDDQSFVVTGKKKKHAVDSTFVPAPTPPLTGYAYPAPGYR